MIISPPFLPAAGLTAGDNEASPPGLDPMMDLVDTFELAHGIYPFAFDRRWHCGVHLMPSTQNEKVRAIADGEVVAYRVCQKAYDGGDGSLDSNAGFVLLKHSTETGEGRTITFYSLYMHLLDLNSYTSMSADGGLLPAFLRTPSPGGDLEPALAQSGSSTLRVRRKDVIGWIGGCHGQRHLHFEIFMTKPDYDAYFGRTQLGSPAASMAAGSDCWGHSCFMIPAGKSFKRLPDGAGPDGKLKGIAFDALQAGQNAGQLFVEMFFHKGSKYTNVWAVTSDGKRNLLTATPVKEKDYEYDMYKRATALYPACASDGYELLRFGRILSTPVTLTTPAARATWMRVTFAAGQEGYIDVSDDAILKLSDADFSTFMGWQKITEGNTPFSADGLCDIDALKKILKDVKDHQTPQDATLKQEYKKEDVLAQYVKSNASVREQLRGFICEAPSEWDSSHNEERYRKLKDEGEFYHGDDAGYAAFMKRLTSFQFWNKTGLDTEQKLWFFHPLAFVRNFRKCGWLSKGEFELVYSDSHYKRNSNPTPDELRSKYLIPLNLATRKFGLVSPLRLAHFLGQGAVESGWLTSMQETSMTGVVLPGIVHGKVKNPTSQLSEASLGHWYGKIDVEDDPWFRSEKFNSHGGRISSSYDWRNGNCDKSDSQKFRGRGFKQLTGRSNYADYWVFRGWINRASFNASWWLDPEFIRHNRSAMKKIPADIADPQRVSLPENCIDSGAFYLVCERPKVTGTIDKDIPSVAIVESQKQEEKAASRAVTYAINGGYIDDVRRLECTRLAKGFICD